MEPYFSQLDLINTILKWLDKSGAKYVPVPRRMNGIIRCADEIIEIMESPDRPVTPGMGLKAWYECDEVGDSSKFMARVLAETAGLWHRHAEENHPHDTDDWSRCLMLLEAEPKLRPHVGEMRAYEGWAEWIDSIDTKPE